MERDPKRLTQKLSTEEAFNDLAVTLAADDLIFVAPTESSGAVRVKELMELMDDAGWTLGYVVQDTGTMQFKRDDADGGVRPASDIIADAPVTPHAVREVGDGVVTVELRPGNPTEALFDYLRDEGLKPHWYAGDGLVEWAADD